MPPSKQLFAKTQKPEKVFHQEGGVEELNKFCII